MPTSAAATAAHPSTKKSVVQLIEEGLSGKDKHRWAKVRTRADDEDGGDGGDDGDDGDQDENKKGGPEGDKANDNDGSADDELDIKYDYYRPPSSRARTLGLPAFVTLLMLALVVVAVSAALIFTGASEKVNAHVVMAAFLALVIFTVLYFFDESINWPWDQAS